MKLLKSMDFQVKWQRIRVGWEKDKSNWWKIQGLHVIEWFKHKGKMIQKYADMRGKNLGREK